MKRKYSEKDFINAVKTSTSIRQVLSKLKLKECGGNYVTVKNYIKKLQLDTTHFTGMLWSKGKTLNPRRPIEDYLSNKQSITSHKLKLRLLKEKYLEYRCYNCNLTEWLEQPIPLELHHIDGEKHNNSLDNLTLLCPNCHAQTDNYRGKNIK